MVKKVLVLALGLVLSIGVMAQYQNPVVPQSDIQFWTGTGSNRAVIAVTWNDATAGNIGVAWGVQWNGTNVSVAALMDTIAAYDANFTIEHGTATYTLINNLTYTNAELGLNLVGPAGWWWYNWKAADGSGKQSESAGADMMVDGDFVDWLPMDEETYASYPADTMIMATDPNAAPVEPQPEEASISAEQIVFWAGTGANRAILAVNWADTALAWGCRFSTDNITVQDAMDSIAAADHRFSYVIDTNGYLSDIIFVMGGTDTLRGTSYWESKHNGIGGYAGLSQTMVNNDFEKWCDPAAGVAVDSSYYEGWGWSYIYVYPMTIHPVNNPAGIANVQSLSVSVYPNPVATMLNVSFETLESAADAVLYDMAGRKVYSRSLAAGSSSVQVPVSQLGEGVYLLRVAGAAAKVVVSR